MTILFLGTGDIGLPSLRYLLSDDSTHTLLGVVTQPDKPVGRRGTPQAPAVKALALDHNVPVLQPEKIRDPETLDHIRSLNPDLILVVAYGQLLPESLFKDIPNLACINLHASLLPKHRGAAPIQAALRDGDPETGITVMHITKELDAGDMILKKSLPIDPADTAQSLHDKLADLAVPALAEALDCFAGGNAPRTPQPHANATHTPKLSKADGHIDWTLPADQIERLIRAYHPWPGTFTTWINPDTQKPLSLKIFPPTHVANPQSLEGRAPALPPPGQIVAASPDGITIATGTTPLTITALQAEGRKKLPAPDFLRGTPLNPGQQLR
ncbi:MAG: methionyl-tRNA formyltransferase [Verrucomicrobiota bacterium]